jgi:formylmethanofuran dehydrogenase subunit E
MQPLDDLLREAEVAHGHLCAGQILGVRMAMLGCACLGIDDPKDTDRKRLVTFVEIDRCATDAIGVVTGCRLGKRALKVRDWGKMAATFVDLAANKAVRIAALETSREKAKALHPKIENKNQQQMLAYRELPDDDLFTTEWVRVPIHLRELPGYKSARIVCDLCGEGINHDREIVRDSETLCQACAFPESCYYQPLTAEEIAERATPPKNDIDSKAGRENIPLPACEHC